MTHEKKERAPINISHTDLERAFEILDRKMLAALDIRRDNPSKKDIIDKAKVALFEFSGAQVTLQKYYHEYIDGTIKAGYIFIYNKGQNMETLTRIIDAQ